MCVHTSHLRVTRSSKRMALIWHCAFTNRRTPRLFYNVLFQPRRSSVLRAFLRYTALRLQYNVTHRCLCVMCQSTRSDHHPIVVDCVVRAAVLAGFFHRSLPHGTVDMELEGRAQRSGSGTKPAPVIGILSDCSHGLVFSASKRYGVDILFRVSCMWFHTARWSGAITSRCISFILITSNRPWTCTHTPNHKHRCVVDCPC